MTREEKIRLIQLLRIKKQRAELRQQESNESDQFAETAATSANPQVPAEDAPEVVDWSKPQVAQIMPPMPKKTLGAKIIGGLETGASLASGALTTPFLMPFGVAKGLFVDATGGYGPRPKTPSERYERSDMIQDTAMEFAGQFTRMPKTEAGQEYLGDTAEFLGRFPAYMGAQAPAMSSARMGAKLQAEKLLANRQQRVEGSAAERGVLIDTQRRAAGDSLAPLAIKANNSSISALARGADVDPKRLAAAESLGVEAPIPLLSKSKEFQELSTVLKSIPDGEISNAWLKATDEIGKKADDAMREVSTMDKASVSGGVKKKIQSAIDDLKAQENVIYETVKASIPEDSRVFASKTMGYLDDRIAKLGKESMLSKVEKQVLEMVRSEQKAITRRVQGIPKTTIKTINPLYGAVDEARKIAGEKTKSFKKPREMGQAKTLYRLLEEDLDSAHQSFGPGFSALRDQAKALTKARYKLDDDMTMLFGKKAESMLPTVDTATGAISKGNYDAFAKMINAVPEDMRSDVAITALRSKLMSNDKLDHAQFANFYDKLKSNPRAYGAIMRNIPKEQRQQLNAVARLSKGIRDLEATNPAKARAIKSEFGDSRTLMDKVYRFGSRPAAMLGTQMLKLNKGGIAYAVGAALTAERRGKRLKSADDLIASKSFYDLATKGEKSSIENMARSAEFIKFAKENGIQGNFSQRVEWITDAMKITVGDPEAEQEPAQ